MKFSENFLKRHIRSNPKSLLFAYYAEHLLKSDKLQEAYELCKYGVEMNPQFATGWLVFGRIAQAADQRDFAKTCWLKALAEDRMCLQAAELLLQDENLDLKPEQVLDAGNAILSVDSKNPLALKRVNQLTSKAEETESSAESVATSKAEPDSSETGDVETDEKFDIYGVDKHNTEGIEHTLTEIEEKEASEEPEAEIPDETEGSSDLDELEPPEITGLGSQKRSEKETMKSSKNDEVELRITPRLATFTFAEVLKSQGLYDQAYEVLEMMRQKNVSPERIDKQQEELKRLMDES
jgi:tetratricopeptide (TPR) repeat protein